MSQIKKIFLLFLMVFLIASASAQIQTLGTFRLNNCVELKQFCANCTYVNVTSVLYPNSSIALADVEMTKVGTNYNYSFCYTNVSGTYIVNTLGDPNGNSAVAPYTFEINPSGVAPNDARTTTRTVGTVALLCLSVILFLAFAFMKTSLPIRLTVLSLSVLFFVAGFNVIFISMQNEAVSSDLVGLFSGLSAISFYIYWFIAGFVLILWLFTFLYNYFYKQNMKAAQTFGGGNESLF